MQIVVFLQKLKNHGSNTSRIAMVLNTGIIKKINDFVYVKPRTIQEIAGMLGKNWRTADSYVSRIAKETGTLSTRTFRSGTRGALKIVYWSSIEKIHSMEFQEKLLKSIESSNRKEHFSPFDIYQYVDADKRNAVMRTVKSPAEDNIKDYLKSAQSQVLSFSGNLSWINTTENKERLVDVVEDLARNNISIKIISRITIDGISNLKKILSVNEKAGRNAIEIRHRDHPLRGFVIDDRVARFREVRDPLDSTAGLSEKILLFYEIYDKEWVEWFQKVFWYFFRASVPAEKRMGDLNSIQNLYKYS
jgi:hypothetical protein